LQFRPESGLSASAPKKKPIEWSWRSRVVRGWVYQAVALLLIGGAIWFLAYNTQENMRVRGIQSGFDFLGAGRRLRHR
jgi:general L-amino acid transport system permease protein